MKKYLNFAVIGFLALVMIGSGFNKLRKYNELPSPNFLVEKYSNNSIEYNLDVLQRGVDEERFADNEGFRCVLDVLKLMNENKQTRR